TAPGYLGSRRPVTVYRARDENDDLGVVFYPVIADGYNSQIELAVAITRDGTIAGVRVIRETETEELGDQVNQNNSDWILSFTDKSYDNVPKEQWRVESEGGYFDQISGATITSRSVINSVRNTLDYHAISDDALYK
ncbi:MAG: RnfABCDGE type electron transport complex subunit G, partial [Gammaproteobacteria bacterium]